MPMNPNGYELLRGDSNASVVGYSDRWSALVVMDAHRRSAASGFRLVSWR